MAADTRPQRVTSAADDQVTDLWASVVKGLESINAQLDAAVRSAFNLNTAEADTLASLSRTEGHRAAMTTLAAAAGFSSGGFTKIADRLVARELVRRVPCPDDRRVTYLELTPSGVELAQEMRCLVADINRSQFIDVLGIERAQLLADWVQEMREA